jgi:predicted DNA-binding protein (MmcQ/YjbR family)
MFDTLRAFALTFPGAFEDSPWGDAPVVKVGKKIFVFFGTPEEPGIAVKLPSSAEQARALPGARPTGYGLGRHGWVDVPTAGPDAPPRELVEDWIEESYRAIAPKKLIAKLDSRMGT